MNPERREPDRHHRPAMRRLIVVLGLAVSAAYGRPQSPPPLELVESIPVETILDNPEIRNTREVWLGMIAGAQHTLDIEQFYIANAAGEALDTIITAVMQAAERGVRVRLIVDSRMYKTYPATADSLGRHPGIMMRVIDYGKIAGGIQHAKFFIVDGRTAFLGSQNFDWRALVHIHELGLRIDHEATARAFARVFDTDWSLAASGPQDASAGTSGGEPVAVPIHIPVGAGDTARLTPTWSPRGLIPDTLLWDQAQIVRLIDGASSEVLLQFLSYSTTGRDGTSYTVIDDALRRAARRGVDVKLIVADWEKATPAEKQLKDLSTIRNIAVRFSVIPPWSGGYVSYARVEHCKFIVADGSRFWLGTSNCEKSYFTTSRNIGVVCEHEPLAGTLRRIFNKGWDGPYVEPVLPDRAYAPRKHGGD